MKSAFSYVRLTAAILFTGSLLILGANAVAGPFGLNMGDSVRKIKSLGIVLEKDEEFRYTARSLPKGSSDMDIYSFLITPVHGLCEVGAGAYITDASKYGTEYKDTFKKFKKSLRKKYGSSTDYDFLKVGSIWDAPNEYSMSLFQDERVLSSYWPEEGGVIRKDNIDSISLRASGVGRDYGLVMIKYEYANAEKCRQFESEKDSAEF